MNRGAFWPRARTGPTGKSNRRNSCCTRYATHNITTAYNTHTHTHTQSMINIHKDTVLQVFIDSTLQNCKNHVFSHTLTSNRNQYPSSDIVFCYAAEKIPSTCARRADRSTDESDPCSATGIFRRVSPASQGLSRVCVDQSTCSRSHDFRWNRTGPWWFCAAGREISRLYAVLLLD